MFVLFALLLSIAGGVQASEAPHDKLVAAWSACEEKVMESPEAKRVEAIGGRTGVVELVHKRCGSRPVIRRLKGRLALDDEACAALFRWHTEGVCVVEDTVGLDLFARTLDPRVFDREKYRGRCEGQRISGLVDDYRSFRAAVCEEGRDARH